MLIIRLMTENAIKKFLRVYGKSFPLKKKFNFTGFCKDVKSLIDKDYDYLLMRNRDYYSNRKKREQFKTKISIDLKNIGFNENSFFENKRKHLMKKQKLMLSSYNNKMILDLMFNDKRYVKYITEKNNENSNPKNRNDLEEKTEESINNNLIKNNKTNDIFSSLITYDSIDEFNIQKDKFLKQKNYLNKTYSKLNPTKLKSILKQNHSIFKTEIPIKQSKISPSIRNSLFNIHLRNKSNKYINHNSKFPTLSNNFPIHNSRNINTNNQFQKFQKNSELSKTNINYNKNLRKQIIFNDIYSHQKSIDKNNGNNNKNLNSKFNSTSKEKNLISSTYKPIRLIKSNIFIDAFNSKKQFFKQK